MSLRRAATPFLRTACARQTRSVSSSSRLQLLQTQTTDPEVERATVSRLSHLMELGDRLAQTAGSKGVPGRLRGTGLYSKRAETTPVVPVEELKPLPKTRRIIDSYVQQDLLFSQNDALREQYVGGLSKIRMGRLMEDFDSLAGAAAYRFVLPDGCPIEDASKYGLYLVTAAVDRMDVLRPLTDFAGNVPDLRISGHVSFATESSVEVFVRLSTIPTETEDASTILIGRFAMACRKSSGGKQPIAKLLIEGAAEEELWKMGKELKEAKKQRALQSLDKSPPSAEEARKMHEIFVGRQSIFERNAPTPTDVCWMSDTKLNSAQLMHPQERNVHNKVFGGYLMRLAYETAYSTACLFSRSPVTFIALDELRFALPVEIGSLLLLNSRVTFSPIIGEHKSFHVSVEAATTDLYTGERKVTNTFHFTFASDKPLDRHVLPRSYKQAMAWLDAQRRRETGISVRKAYDA